MERVRADDEVVHACGGLLVGRQLADTEVEDERDGDARRQRTAGPVARPEGLALQGHQEAEFRIRTPYPCGRTRRFD